MNQIIINRRCIMANKRMIIKEIHTNPDIAPELHGNVLVVDHIDIDNYVEYLGKTVKVTGDVNLSNLGLTKLPINFTEVGGYFICTFNKLTSLKGGPKEVGGYFWCSENQLTSLEGAPRKVGHDFVCRYNKLTSLKGAPEEVGGNFDCSHNPLLVGRPEFIGGEFIS